MTAPDREALLMGRAWWELANDERPHADGAIQFWNWLDEHFIALLDENAELRRQRDAQDAALEGVRRAITERRNAAAAREMTHWGLEARIASRGQKYAYTHVLALLDEVTT